MMTIALPYTLNPSKNKFCKLKEFTMKTKEGKLKEWTRKMKDWTQKVK